MTYAELRTQYPKAVSWARAHPILLAVIVAGGVFLLLIGFLIVLFSVLFSGI